MKIKATKHLLARISSTFGRKDSPQAADPGTEKNAATRTSAATRAFGAQLLSTLLAIFTVPFATAADARATYQFNLPEQTLSEALKAIGQQTTTNILFDPESVQNRTAPALRATLTAQQAIEHVLQGTNLIAKQSAIDTVLVQPLTPKQMPLSALGERGQGGEASPPLSTREGRGEGKEQEFWSRFRLAQADTASGTGSSSSSEGEEQTSEDSSTNPQKRTTLEEIVVTAQKRIERLQDVPVPVTAIDANSLVDSNQMRIQDYYTKIPGFSLIMLGDTGVPVATIRGVSTGGYTNPTVGVVVDDVPFGASTVATGGYWVPDFDPSELSRIEVLRGPQGTLYGAGSMGGLLKYVTVDPSTDSLSGRLQGGITSLKNGDEVGYNLRGSVNVPLGDTWGIRASGFTRREPGYIDDPALGIEGVNHRDADAGRVAALWRPSEGFSLRLSALLQQTKRHGEDTTHRQAGLADLQHRDLRDTGWLDEKLQAYSATVVARLGRTELTALSGYSINETSLALDVTPALGALSQLLFGVTGTPQIGVSKTDKFTQEIRLSTPIGERIEWLLGGFYAHEDSPVQLNMLAVNPTTGSVAGSWLDSDTSSTFAELAAFTNLTFHATDRFDIQVGGRASQTRFATGGGTSTGPWNTLILGQPSLTVVTQEFESKDNAFTYLVTPQFEVSPDLMVYARLASGYRPGGPNTSALARSLGLPPEYGADTTQNYEIGVKGNVLDRLLTFDASVYYIDWKDIQIQLKDPTTTQLYYVNAGRARSQGVELSVELRPVAGLSIAAWAAYNDAKLTRVPLTSFLVARPGDQLPYSSPFSGNVSVDREFPLWNRATGFVGASASFIDERRGRFFQNALPRQVLPSYTQVDLRAGMSYGSWTLNAFVNNVTDKRGVLRGGRDASLSLPYAFTYTQPRTVGVSASTTF